MFQQIINIITAPTVAFTDLREKPTILLPLLLVVFITCLAQVLIINSIDFDYLMDSMVEIAMQNPNSAPESEIRQGLAVMTPTIITISGVAGAAIGLPLINAIFALYLWFIAKFSDGELGFKHFFSLTCWTSITSLVATVAATLMILLSSDKQFSQNDLNPLTLGNLFFKGNEAIPAAISSVSLTTFWTLALVIVGFKVFNNSSWTKASIVVLLIPVLFTAIRIYLAT